MTIREASERYGLPMRLLRAYESWRPQENAREQVRYDESDRRRLSVMMTLQASGFGEREIERYMKLLLAGEATRTERLQMLERKRSGTLEEIHCRERQIDRLDYLLFEIRRSMSEKKGFSG